MASHDHVCDAGASALAYVWWWNPETQSEWKFCAHHNTRCEQWMISTGHRVTRDLREDLTKDNRLQGAL